MINGEKAASRAPAFIKRLNRSRQALLKYLMDNHYSNCNMEVNKIK